MSPPEPSLIAPTVADLDGLLALSRAAHWNQTTDDWRWMLAHGRTRALRLGEQLIASTLVLPWQAGATTESHRPHALTVAPSVAWISMVLVLPEYRGQGHAGRLLRESLSWLDEPGQRHLLPVLDATPAGRPVYLAQGFADCWGFTRWENRNRAAVTAGRATWPVWRMNEADISGRRRAAVYALDRLAFGADRSQLIDELARRAPELCLAAGEGQEVDGFLLARPGRVATQIGPLIARDIDCARALLSHALMRADGPIFIDVPDSRTEFTQTLRNAGLVEQRPFTRMALSRSRPDAPATIATNLPGSRQYTWAVAGPELG